MQPPHRSHPSPHQVVEIPTQALDAMGVPQARLRQTPSKELLSVRSSLSLPGVELWQAKASTRLWTVFHTSYDFCCSDPNVKTGGQWITRGRTFTVGQNSTMVMQPGDIHRTIQVDAPVDFHVLLVSPTAFDLAFDGESGRQSSQLGVSQNEHPATARAFRDLCYCLNSAYGDPLEEELQLHRFLWSVVWGSSEDAKKPPLKMSLPAMRRASELLNDGYSETILLDKLSSEAGLSKFELCRMFTSAFGVTPHRYLLCVRVTRACDLLRRGVSSKDVACEVGFCDQQHMSKVFKRLLGMTPNYFIDRQRRATKAKSHGLIW